MLTVNGTSPRLSLNTTKTILFTIAVSSTVLMALESRLTTLGVSSSSSENSRKGISGLGSWVECSLLRTEDSGVSSSESELSSDEEIVSAALTADVVSIIEPNLSTIRIVS